MVYRSWSAYQVIRDTGQDTGFEDAEKKTNCTGLGPSADESCSQGSNAKADRNGRDEPARTPPFADDVGRDLEDDVRDVEDGQDGVVIVALHAEILLETCQTSVAFASG
jgi:hypothetical protein